MHNRGAILRLESKLTRAGADFDRAEEEVNAFVCINASPSCSVDRYLYVTFMAGDLVEFFYNDEDGPGDVLYYNLELHEDICFGRHLRIALKWLGY